MSGLAFVLSYQYFLCKQRDLSKHIIDSFAASLKTPQCLSVAHRVYVPTVAVESCPLWAVLDAVFAHHETFSLSSKLHPWEPFIQGFILGNLLFSRKSHFLPTSESWKKLLLSKLFTLLPSVFARLPLVPTGVRNNFYLYLRIQSIRSFITCRKIKLSRVGCMFVCICTCVS